MNQNLQRYLEMKEQIRNRDFSAQHDKNSLSDKENTWNGFYYT
jgi:hypothetical protein